MTHKNMDFHVPVLTRVEGEGAMHVTVADGIVSDVRLEIYEPPRFFEALVGRGHTEPPDITARICGICPVAYQMSACHAIERACGVTVSGQLGPFDACSIAASGSRVTCCTSAFSTPPTSSGIHRGSPSRPTTRTRSNSSSNSRRPAIAWWRSLEDAPSTRSTSDSVVSIASRRPEDLGELLPELEEARERCIELVRWTAEFEVPEATVDVEFVSLRHPDEYPFNEGRVVSDRGLDIDVSEFEGHMVEVQVPHSTALHGRRPNGDLYHVGPLARYANNFDLAAGRARISPTSSASGPS